MDDTEPLPWPIDLGYIKCQPCMNDDHGKCIGLKRTRPFCGCRCPWLMTIDDTEPETP